MDHAADRQHGQTAVCQLLRANVHLRCLVLGKELLAEVQVSRLALGALALKHVQHVDLAVVGVALDGASDKKEGSHRWNRRGVYGLCGIWRASHTRESEERLSHEAQGRQHAHTAMLQLCLLHPAHIPGGRQLQRVKLRLIACEALEIRWLGQERHALGESSLRRGSRGGSSCSRSCLASRCAGGPADVTGGGADSAAKRRSSTGLLDLLGGEEGPLLSFGQHAHGHNAAVGQHRQAAVPELLQLHLALALRVFRVP
mmetsp:Transcript_26151/g.41850  ORF Transcript_26151/g.41850 Transcript_26151/m.41850 type:complete len:257 (-) Transcript_26151:295-1065(-)